MTDTEALPTKLTIELYYDARVPEEFGNGQEILALFLDKWNHGKNKFCSDPIGKVNKEAF